MATMGSKFFEDADEAEETNENREVSQQAEATNENREFPQQTQTTNEDSTVAVPQDARQGDTTERVDMVPVRSQNESGGVKAWVPGNRHLSWVTEKWRQWRSRPVLQGKFMDADENIKDSKIIYRSIIERSTMTPYPFKFHDPAHIITGIACLPKDAETPSPEVEVVRGGVGFKEVAIVLKPFEKGNWCCHVQINGIEDNRLEIDSSSYKELSM